MWLREKLKAGAKLEDFAVQKNGGFPQSFAEEIQEATQVKVMKVFGAYWLPCSPRAASVANSISSTIRRSDRIKQHHQDIVCFAA